MSRILRIAIIGAASAALAVAGGLISRRILLGADDRDALARIERRVRDEFRSIETSLRATGRSLSARAELIQTAGEDENAARDLFEAVGVRPGAPRDEHQAVTIYGMGAQPLAWSGRPSELPSDRLLGPEALFVAPGAVGLRLVYVVPVTVENRRVGSVAVERVLSATPGVRATLPTSYVLPGVPVPVPLVARFEGAGAVTPPGAFLISTSGGEALLEARIPAESIQAEFDAWRVMVRAVGMTVLAITLLGVAVPVLTTTAGARRGREHGLALIATTIIVVAVWGLLRAALPPMWPTRFLLVSMLLAGLVLIAWHAIERGRVTRIWRGVGRLWSPSQLAVPIVASSIAGGALLLYQYFLGRLLAGSRIDVLHLSLHPYDPARLAVSFGFVFLHGAIIWMAVLLLRWSWLVQTPGTRPPRRNIAILLAWVLPIAGLVAIASRARWPIALAATIGSTLVVVLGAAFASRWLPRYRHASQAARLGARFIVVLVPTLVSYPVMVHFASISRRDLVEQDFARQVMSQREDVQLRVRRSLEQIAVLGPLGDLVSAPPAAPGVPVPSDQAFRIWSQTELATFRLTSAVELYSADGSLVSRFALNLPEISPSAQKWTQPTCGWELFEEVSPIGSEERRLLHAGAGICEGGDRPDAAKGAIVVHAMLDYNALPFISSQSPYYELFRGDRPPEEGMRGREIEFAVYGWSLTPLYTSSATAWTIDDRVFRRIYASRDPFWTQIERDGQAYDVYFMNDRFGLYALGYPALVPMGHLLNIAELVVLVAVTYVAISRFWWVLSRLTGARTSSAAGLLREIRASFYRKLFLAFVLVAAGPVVILALLARAYTAGQLRADIESSAQRTASVAQRVIEYYASLQTRGETTGPTLDDDVLVWLSRVIDQDVNVFEGSRLAATSERDLFASGLLPTRTPADVYYAVLLNHVPGYVAEEGVGGLTYLVAAASVRAAGGRNAILTIPLASRQREIEREKDDLDRRILLAALIFILTGALSGYAMAERIADPVNRLSRATRRIAKGDLDARIAATSSDELRRLVEDFNSMAAELQRQRTQLERTHRLEAWAEMARQVAHDIKNPLTPIQLSAEHLMRVHADQGRPLSPVLEECLDSILLQVRLLRQIASEFSSFGSSPTPRPTATSVAEVVHDVVRPYEAGLAKRVVLDVRVPGTLPQARVDRTLLARALTNIIENALHAMPGGGTLTIVGTEGDLVQLAVSDTGVGMEPEALARIFEPYFSTKATGTGLGLTIAKRNIELVGGTIDVESARGRGTTVTLALPRA